MKQNNVITLFISDLGHVASKVNLCPFLIDTYKM